jgi:hypothetical protein
MRIYLGCLVAMTALAACTRDDSGDDASDGGGYGGGNDDGGGAGGSSDAPSDDCPGSSRCSPTGPSTGLVFSGAQPVLGELGGGDLLGGHNHILSGGTDDITLLVGGSTAAFLAPYATATTVPLIVTSTEREVVHLTETDGTGELQIINPSDGLLFDTYHYASSSLSSAQAVSELELVSSPDWLFDCADAFVFWPGTIEVGVAMWGTTGHRLVDTSLALDADVPGATQSRWDRITIPNAAVGVHTVQIASGSGTTTTAQVRVVDEADAIRNLASSNGLICFGAYADQTFISHAPFVFTVDGVATLNVEGLGPNCVAAPTGSTVVASVPGASLTIIAGSGGSQRQAEVDHRLAQLRAARAAVQ